MIFQLMQRLIGECVFINTARLFIFFMGYVAFGSNRAGPTAMCLH